MDFQKRERRGGMHRARGSRGVVYLIFGAMLLCIGLLDFIFAFKTGISGGRFNMVIILSGAVIFAIGLFVTRSKTTSCSKTS